MTDLFGGDRLRNDQRGEDQGGFYSAESGNVYGSAHGLDGDPGGGPVSC